MEHHLNSHICIVFEIVRISKKKSEQHFDAFWITFSLPRNDNDSMVISFCVSHCLSDSSKVLMTISSCYTYMNKLEAISLQLKWLDRLSLFVFLFATLQLNQSVFSTGFSARWTITIHWSKTKPYRISFDGSKLCDRVSFHIAG